MGLTHFVTTSDGEKIENPRFLKDALPELRRAQRSLSRKKKGGKTAGKPGVGFGGCTPAWPTFATVPESWSCESFCGLFLFGWSARSGVFLMFSSMQPYIYPNHPGLDVCWSGHAALPRRLSIR